VETNVTGSHCSPGSSTPRAMLVRCASMQAIMAAITERGRVNTSSLIR